MIKFEEYKIFGRSVGELQEDLMQRIERVSGAKINRNFADVTAAFTKRWYETADPSFYNTAQYVTVQLECFNDWTMERTLQMIQFLASFELPRTEAHQFQIVDFGAGAGLSTMMLAEAFPASRVYYVDSYRYGASILMSLAVELGIPNIRFCTNLDDVDIIPDVVCAFDVFEHFEEPLPVLEQLLQNGLVPVYIDSSSFKYKAPGHFDNYWFGEEVGYVDANYAKPLFHDKICEYGYLPTDEIGLMEFPNLRPRIFIRRD